ncbi:unnamed protein product, partial [Scytosiphon promiscuus]
AEQEAFPVRGRAAAGVLTRLFAPSRPLFSRRGQLFVNLRVRLRRATVVTELLRPTGSGGGRWVFSVQRNLARGTSLNLLSVCRQACFPFANTSRIAVFCDRASCHIHATDFLHPPIHDCGQTLATDLFAVEFVCKLNWEE